MTDQTKGTAFITGASSGIGAAFAQQLAAQGYDLVLVARRVDRLRALADELTKQHSVCVEPLSADLSVLADVERLEKSIAAHDNLTLLVNNAGFGNVGSFVQIPIEQHLAMIKVHIMASVRLCHAALPKMIQHKRGTIINVSSTAAFLPMSVSYSSSKAYLNLFCEGLQLELKGTGIHVQALCPGLTHTGFHDSPEFQSPDSMVQKAPKFMWMSADQVVATSLRALGSGSVICVPGWINRVMAVVSRSAFAPLLVGAMSRQGDT